MASESTTAAPPAPYASASLYVGDLAQDVTEAQLFEIFNQIGGIVSIRVCRDTVTRRSLGYAYVNFHNVNEAERALDTLNYTPIRGIPCRIMWSHRDPAVRRNGAGNIFVKNLEKSIDSKALFDTFSAFGNILSCKVMLDDKGQSAGFGFVHYETAEAAEAAIKKVDGMLLNDHKVFVGYHQRRTERGAGAGGEIQFTNCYVKNLDENTSDQELLDLFSKHGKVTSCVIMRDQGEHKSKGFGFVNFEDFESAKRAVAEVNGTTIGQKVVYVGRAQKKSEREAELRAKFEALRQERINKYQGVNLFIKNLDDSVDDNKLRLEFEQFGTITSAKVMRDEKGLSKGFGFVCFDQAQPEAATKAVTDMNGKVLGGKPVYVALAQRKEVRRAQLEAQHQMRMHSRMALRPDLPGQPGIFPAGAPVFYANQHFPHQQRQFMYPNQGPMRQRWQPQPGQQGQRPAPYSVPNAAYVGGGGRGVPGARQPGATGPRQPRPAGPGGVGGRGGLVQPGQQRVPQGGRGRPAQGGARLDALTSSMLAAASPDLQKRMLGERLFPLVSVCLGNERAHLAGKITGMLLEMDNSELLLLLDNDHDLASKVDEALRVLSEHDDEKEN